jgi:cytochrome c oxidase accessory protein FixG
VVRLRLPADGLHRNFLWIEKRSKATARPACGSTRAPVGHQARAQKRLKHFLWIVFGLWTGFTFVGYFTPIRELWPPCWPRRSAPGQTFWMLFYGFATYGNAGFMREQVCKYMCPYARFQSAMFDKDTLIVTYDTARGEPRGARWQEGRPRPAALGPGRLCRLHLCVQVCPTGIDIRKGLQYECIGCGACADVCDDVMDKMGYPRGLVKYSTQNGMGWWWWRPSLQPSSPCGAPNR